MSIKKDLQHSITRVLKQNRSGSFATRANRAQMLLQFAEDIVSLGYGLRDIRALKQKHITAAVQHWQEKQLKVATIKNRMSAIRTLCQTINKSNIVPSNTALNIGRRTYTPIRNRALFEPNFSGIHNPYIRMSVELQRVFGLRREESLKIKPHLADKGDQLELSPSWCKGGRGRFIPIRTEEQRLLLEQAKQLAKKLNHSLIPVHKSYVQQVYIYDKQVMRAGLRNLHGLRHAYAQQRYKELTGWDAPINSGPNSKQLTSEQKILDYRARMILTEELGHGRAAVVANYCGK